MSVRLIGIYNARGEIFARSPVHRYRKPDKTAFTRSCRLASCEKPRISLHFHLRIFPSLVVRDAASRCSVALFDGLGCRAAEKSSFARVGFENVQIFIFAPHTSQNERYTALFPSISARDGPIAFLPQTRENPSKYSLNSSCGIEKSRLLEWQSAIRMRSPNDRLRGVGPYPEGYTAEAIASSKIRSGIGENHFRFKEIKADSGNAVGKIGADFG